MNRNCKFSMLFLCSYFIVSFCFSVDAQEHKSSSDGYSNLLSIGIYRQSVLSDVDIKDFKAAAEIWLRAWCEKEGFKTKTYIYEDINSLEEDLQNGTLNIISTTPRYYFRLSKKVDMELMFVNIIGGKKSHKFLLLVRSDSRYDDVKDLRDKRLAIRAGDEMGLLYLNTVLLRNKEREAGKFFSSVIENRKFSQAILGVFFRQIDACLVNDVVFNIMTELNPQVGEQLRIIASSPEIVNDVTYIRKDFDETDKRIFRNRGLKINETTEGKQIMMLFQVDGIDVVKESDLQTVKGLLVEYEELKNKSKTDSTQ